MLKVTRGVNEVVSTIMLNFIATGITAYLLAEHWRNKARRAAGGDEDSCRRSGWLPVAQPGARRWIGYHLPRGVALQGFLVIAILTGIVFYLVVYRTRFGFDLRATGANPRAALASGVQPEGA